MPFKLFDVSIRQLDDNENIPYDLLLLADPSKEMIDRYVAQSKVFVATLNLNIIGTLVLFPVSAHAAEIKNIAVKGEFQGKGVGKLLLDFAIETARKENYSSICIATANSSVGQLHLYQTKEFEVTGMIKNFFLDNYPEPIYEKGIQAKHLIVLTRNL